MQPLATRLTILLLLCTPLAAPGASSAAISCIALPDGYAAAWVIAPPPYSVLYRMFTEPTSGDAFLSSSRGFVRLAAAGDSAVTGPSYPDGAVLFTGAFARDGSLYANGHDEAGVLYRTTDLQTWDLVTALPFGEGNYGFVCACGAHTYFSQGAHTPSVVYTLADDGSYAPFVDLGFSDQIGGMQCDQDTGTLYVIGAGRIFSIDTDGAATSIWMVPWGYLSTYFLNSFALKPGGGFYVGLSSMDTPGGKLLVVDQTSAVSSWLHPWPVTELAAIDGNIPSIATREDGDLWVLDATHARVLRVSPADGTQTVVAGGSELQTPGALAFGPDGDLYVANIERGDISRIAADGTVTQFGNGFNLFYGSTIDTDVAFAPDGRLYVAEGDPLEAFVDQLSYVADNGEPTRVMLLDGANGLAAARDSTLYISTSTQGEIWRWSGIAGEDPSLLADHLPLCRNLVLNTEQTTLYATAHQSRQLTVLDAASGDITDTVAGPDSVAELRGLALGADGWLYTTGGDAIYRWRPPAAGFVLFASGLDTPNDLAFAIDGDLYFSQGVNSTQSGVGRITGFSQVELTIQVRDSAQEPMADVEIQITDIDSPTRGLRRRTGSQGQQVCRLAPAAYAIRLLPDGDPVTLHLEAAPAETTLVLTPSAAPGPAEDFNGDGTVDFSDFFLFADAFGGTDARYDLNGDGHVEFADFFLFADAFGATTP